MYNVYRIGYMPRPKVLIDTVESYDAFAAKYGPFLVMQEDSDHPNHFDALGSDAEITQYSLEPVK